MPLTAFFRIAVEGGTTDGRTIERVWLEEMAADYNAETYGARINMEHLRGFSPEPPFCSYGDVIALETREIELQIAGKAEKRLGLYAQLDVTDELVSINQKRQKLYTSCEIALNFAGKGRAYLVALAVTDNPASLGTEMLAFAAGQGDASPLIGRKLDPANLFTAASEMTLELAAAAPADKPVTLGALAELVAGLVARFTPGKPAQDPAQDPPAPPAPPSPPAPPEPAANDNEAFAALAGGLEALTSAIEPLAGLGARVDELAAKLDGTPDRFSRRPLASGAGDRARTDC